MKEIIYAVGIVLALNTLMFLAQQGISEIAPEITYFDYDNSSLHEYDKGNFQLRPFDPNDLPAAESSVSEEGNFFTDIFTSIKNWLLNHIPGARYLSGLINTVPNFLKALGLDPVLAFALGYLWHAFIFFIVVVWLKG